MPHVTSHDDLLPTGLRADFPVLDQVVNGHPLTYLDNAATTQKPRAVIESISHFLERDNANVHRGLHELSTRATAAYEGARERVARFLNAPSADTIVFTRGVTESINLVANSWGRIHLKPGDTVLLTEMEHHANIVPWQMLADITGAHIVFSPVTGDESRLDLDAFRENLAKRPRLAAFTHISNSLGVVNPVAEMCQLAREFGVTTLVDAAQSAGHAPLDVQQIGCDFLAASAHKMAGPTGIGFLYGRAEVLADMPPWQGGGEMIARVRYDGFTPKPPPQRFEAGTPAFVEAAGLSAAIDYLERIGRPAIQSHDRILAAYAASRLAELPGIRIVGPRPGTPIRHDTSDRAALVTFAFADVHAHDVVTFADQRGIALRGGHHCNQPLMRKLGLPASARASFYLYNTTAEVDHLVETLTETLAFFRRGL